MPHFVQLLYRLSELVRNSEHWPISFVESIREKRERKRAFSVNE